MNNLDAFATELLAPIPGDRPAGTDLRRDNYLELIREARREENAQLPRGVWQRDVKQADWPRVEQLCRGALAGRSKDLLLAAWLTESWVQQHGFAGLAPGFRLLDGLNQRYWEGLFPALEEDDSSARAMPIEWLNTKLPSVVRQRAIAFDTDDQFNWSTYIDAQRLEMVRQQDATAARRAEAGGTITLAMFEATLGKTPTDALQSITADLDDALTALHALDATLDSCFGRDAPGLGQIRDVLGEIADFGRAVATARLQFTAPQVPPSDPVTTASTAPSLPVRTAAPLTREAAYQQIRLIAAFLRGAEPHSPVPYLLDRTAELGVLSLPELEAELRDRGSSTSALIDAIGLDYG